MASAVSESEQMSFAQLPADVIGEILSCRDLRHCSLRLWQCGNVLLNYKLARGLRIVSLKDTSPQHTTHWPLILSQFRGLRSLAIFRPLHRLDTVEGLRKGLQSLSPTLEHLSLHCLDSLTAFYRPEALRAVSGGNFLAMPGFLESSRQCMYVRSDRNTSGMWDLENTFPNLQTLVIGGQTFPKNLFDVQLAQADFASLPRSLTFLEINQTPTTWSISAPSWTSFELLPRGLQTLRMGLATCNDPVNIRASKALAFSPELLRTLPPTLTEISGMYILRTTPGISSEQSQMRMQELMDALPPTLTELDRGVELDGLTALPPFLATWHVRNPLSLSQATIPRHLTSVTLDFQGIAGDTIAKLPPTVTRLFVRSLLWTRIAYTDFPSQLNRFESYLPILPSNISLLPASITAIKAPLKRETEQLFELESYKFLSPLIKYFHTTNASPASPFLPQDPQWSKDTSTTSLPRDMEDLAIVACKRYDSQLSLFVAGLPPCLTRLALHLPETRPPRLDIPPDYWPSTLTEFTLKNAPRSVAYWQNLPSRLKRLYHVHCSHGPAFDTKGVAAMLPRSLKVLGISGITIHGRDVQDLPRSLKKLKKVGVGHVPQLTDWLPEHIDHLPSQLKVLQMNFISTPQNTLTLNKDIIHRFPKSLDFEACDFGSSVPFYEWFNKTYVVIYDRNATRPAPVQGQVSCTQNVDSNSDE